MIILENDAIEFLNHELKLPSSGKEQDWDIELSNYKRIGDFIQYYENSELNESTKVALMALIIASIEDYFDVYGILPREWHLIKKLIAHEKELLNPVIKYWALIDEKTRNNLFLITPFIRELI